MEAQTGLEGVYLWKWSGGSFTVELRPFGSFYSKEYPQTATWSLSGSTVTVDWKKYGKYEFQVKDMSTPKLEGGAVGNLSNWRTAEFVRPFTEAELKLLNGGSVWNLEFDQGSFEMDGNKVSLNWGSYGEYEFVLDDSGTTMNGHKKGQPSNWRKLTFLRSLGASGLAEAPTHDH